MPQITYIQSDHQSIVVQADIGESLMEVARDNDVEAILAECGGACACATCHVVVRPPHDRLLPAKQEAESMVLEGALNVEKYSRLACQLTVSEAMDGLEVFVPKGLY